MKPRLKNVIISISGIGVIAAVIFLFAQPVKISGDCMEPAVQDGKIYFVNRVHYYLNPYQVGDIIQFEHEGKMWVSRIVALENNTIKITENTLTINGETQQNSVQRNWTDWQYGTCAVNNAFQVPVKHVYVLSDNLSAHHDDSRVFGAVSCSKIFGKFR